MKQANKPRTCATHNPGSPDCGPNCPDALRDPNATPGLVFAMADGTKVGAPADVARANQFTPASLEPRNTVSSPEVGPESVEDMDDAVDDIEQRDDDSDEVDTDIEGDGPVENTDDEDTHALSEVERMLAPADLASVNEALAENARLRQEMATLSSANAKMATEVANLRTRLLVAESTRPTPTGRTIAEATKEHERSVSEREGR